MLIILITIKINKTSVHPAIWFHYFTYIEANYHYNIISKSIVPINDWHKSIKGILSILIERFIIILSRIKSNNYNKIIIKLQNYHGLLFDLQENGLNKVYNPQKLEYHVNNFNFNFKEIRLALYCMTSLI